MCLSVKLLRSSRKMCAVAQSCNWNVQIWQMHTEESACMVTVRWTWDNGYRTQKKYTCLSHVCQKNCLSNTGLVRRIVRIDLKATRRKSLSRNPLCRAKRICSCTQEPIGNTWPAAVLACIVQKQFGVRTVDRGGRLYCAFTDEFFFEIEKSNLGVGRRSTIAEVDPAIKSALISSPFSGQDILN